MSNYKIRVNNEAESREAQELFFELGYTWQHGKSYLTIGSDWTHLTVYSDGSLSMGFGDAEKELTLPQLHDLVVLHRNDINDANWETEGDDQIYQDSSGKSFIFRKQGWDELQRHEMRQAMWVKTKSKPQTTKKEQGLISGADAKLAWAKGEDLQIDTGSGFEDLTDNYYLAVFDRESNKFRLKPRTVKLEIEVPAPFEPKVGEEYYYPYPHSERGYALDVFKGGRITNQFGAWRTEAEIKIVVEQVRKLKEHSK